MKFIYFSDSSIPPEKVIENYDSSILVVAASLSEFPTNTETGELVLIVLEHEVSAELIDWHNANPKIKIVLISNHLKEVYLRDLQIEHNFYDLFFKYPLAYVELEQKIKMISTFTNTTWKKDHEDLMPKLPEDLSAPSLTLNDTAIDITSLTNGINLTLSEEIKLPQAVPDLLDIDENNHQDLSVVNALMLEANTSEDLSLPIADKPEIESLVAESEIVETLSLESHPSLPEDLNHLFEPTEIKDTLDLNVEHKVDEDDLLTAEPQTFNTLSEDELLVDDVIEERKNDQVIEKVSLNEILENKEDQIYRLMSKNKMLEDEIIEREEIIKQVQKELHDHHSQFDKSKNIVEESNFQINVLKSTHEQEKLDVKNHLEIALSKIKLLENRIDELKKNSGSNTKSSEISLSVSELRKIKARQELLEEKISLLQSDSAIQLQHREKKIIDLKRKIDLLEFDVKDSLERESELKKRIQTAESKMAQMKQVLKQVMEEPVSSENSELPKKTGSYDI